MERGFRRTRFDVDPLWPIEGGNRLACQGKSMGIVARQMIGDT